MANQSRVLITGGAGLIGSKLREELSDHQLRLHDRDVSGVGPLRDNEETVEADLADFDATCEATKDCDAIVHLGGNPRVNAPWPDLKFSNIEGTYNVFEAARLAGVRRIVFASTNHVTGMLDQRKEWPISPAGEIAPDSLYGVSKAFGEAIGRYYAENSDLSVVCLRIGWVNREFRPDHPDWLRMWLSYRDLGQLVRKSIAADVKFGIYYGVSANTPMQYELDNVRRDLGYEPVDDSATIKST